MERNPYSPPASAVEIPARGPVSMASFGFLCFLGLIVSFLVLTHLMALTGMAFQMEAPIVGLLLSIQFATWRFLQTHRRAFLPRELSRFAFACFLAFWVFDELPSAIRTSSSATGWSIKKAAIAMGATGIDFAIVVVLVRMTVPWASRYYLRRASAAEG